MGWFWNQSNSGNQQNIQNNNNSPYFSSSSSYSYSSKKRSCQNDPNDDNYLICKTIIKDNNGTREEEERIPKNHQYTGSFNQNDSFSSSYNQNQNSEKAFQNFPSFFIQPSFFDFHNTSPRHQHVQYQDQQGNRIQKSFNQYSQSRSCHPDPQNNEYLICKSKIFDGKQTKEVEQRVKINSQNMFGFGIPFSGNEFMNFGNEVDRQIQNMMRDMNEGFGFMTPLIGSMFNLINAFDHQNYPKNIDSHHHNEPHRNRSKYTQYHQKSYDNNSHNYFTNSGPKDTNVYDL